MNKNLTIKGTADTAIQGLLRALLEKGEVGAVFGLGDSGEAKSYLLISDPAKIDSLCPTLPFMPANAANHLSKITAGGNLVEKIAVVIKPCELRGFAELVKRESGCRDNLLFISPVCGGVLDFDTFYKGNLDEELVKYREAFFANEIPSNIRPTCAGCEHFVPFNSDITFMHTSEGCEFYSNTSDGEEILQSLGEKLSEGKLDDTRIEKLRSARIAIREKFFEDLKLEEMEIKGLVEAFGKCLGCHGCSSVCPICYCALCAFEAKENEFKPEIFEKELAKRGGVRVPPNTVFFHLGRIAHMAVSCVGCGMCSDACPVDIPVASIFTRAGDAVQKVFDYIPGEKFDEPVPLSTFIEDELTEVEDS